MILRIGRGRGRWGEAGVAPLTPCGDNLLLSGEGELLNVISGEGNYCYKTDY